MLLIPLFLETPTDLIRWLQLRPINQIKSVKTLDYIDFIPSDGKTIDSGTGYLFTERYLYHP